MNDPLRGCPLCKTKVSQVALGLRDYSWLEDTLPGREAPMDLDFVLEKRGELLAIEFKPTGETIPQGQLITLKTLVKKGWTVWIVWGDGPVEVGPMDTQGNVGPVEEMSLKKLCQKVKAWREAAAR